VNPVVPLRVPRRVQSLRLKRRNEMLTKTHLDSLRRVAFLTLAVVLTGLTLDPSVAACGCTQGATRTVYTSIMCCEPPHPLGYRPTADQKCNNCVWETVRSYCSPATCAV
jgi:hypothetical protein